MNEMYIISTNRKRGLMAIILDCVVTATLYSSLQGS